MTVLSEQVKTDTATFLKDNIDLFKAEAKLYGLFDTKIDDPWDEDDIDGMDLTLSTDGDHWSYQTGDNSYTGGAYGLPHWAVLWIGPDTTHEQLYKDAIDQWEDLLSQ